MQVALISDTHIPSRASGFPGWVREAIETSDHLIHAGDFDSPRTHFDQRVLAGGSFTGVVGNMDPSLGLPEVATVDRGGVRFVVTHGDGFGRGEPYRRALADLASEYEADVAVGGHTHRLTDAVVDGVRILNPGSATGAAPAEYPSLITVECDNGTFRVRHLE
ncbi:MAG: metallophosphoesterase family protein [Natronomonas sp.]